MLGGSRSSSTDQAPAILILLLLCSPASLWGCPGSKSSPPNQVKAAPPLGTAHQNKLCSENPHPFIFIPQKQLGNITCFPDKEPQMLEVSLSFSVTFPTAKQGVSGKQQNRIQAGQWKLPCGNCHGNAVTTRGQVLTFVLITNSGMDLNSPWPTILSKFALSLQQQS